MKPKRKERQRQEEILFEHPPPCLVSPPSLLNSKFVNNYHYLLCSNDIRPVQKWCKPFGRLIFDWERSAHWAKRCAQIEFPEDE